MAKTKTAPKSQSEQANERRERAREARSERAGTALLEGKPKLAAKIIAGKTETAADEHKKLVELRALHQKIGAAKLEMETHKGEYKAAKDLAEKLTSELLRMVADSNQAEFPFEDPKDPIRQELEGDDS